jgi:hypothetical protein
VEEKTLTEKESKKIAELLSRAIKNKEHPHPADLQRAAVILYTARQRGYILTEAEVYDIIEQSVYVYAIRTQITRDYYLRRLRTFFDFIKLLPNAKIEDRCNQFASIAIKDHSWTFNKIINFLQFQKERLKETK